MSSSASGKKNRPWEDDTHAQSQRREIPNLQPRPPPDLASDGSSSFQRQFQPHQVSHPHSHHEDQQLQQYPQTQQWPANSSGVQHDNYHYPDSSLPSLRGSPRSTSYSSSTLRTESSPRLSKRRRLSDEEGSRYSTGGEIYRRGSYVLPPPPPPLGGNRNPFFRYTSQSTMLPPFMSTAQLGPHCPPPPPAPSSISSSPRIDSSWRDTPTSTSKSLAPLLNSDYPSADMLVNTPHVPFPTSPPPAIPTSGVGQPQRQTQSKTPSSSQPNSPMPQFSAPTASQSKSALQHQIFYLSQENQQLRNDLARSNAERFVPGGNLRGIVIKLFELAEDYSEVIMVQQGASLLTKGIRSNEEDKEETAGVSYVRKRPLTDNDLMSEEGVVACLRRMHTSLKARFNVMKMAKSSVRKPHTVPSGLIQEREGQGPRKGGSCDCESVKSKWMQERGNLLSRAAWLEKERTMLQDKIGGLMGDQHAEVSMVQPSSLLRNTDLVKNFENLPTRMPNLTCELSQTSIPSHMPQVTSPTSEMRSRPSTAYEESQAQPQGRHDQYSGSTTSMSPSTPSTLAPSISVAPPSTAVFNETLTTLQHRLSLTELLLETLQGEHARLRAALTRSQTRAAALEKKYAVSEEENNALLNDRDRYQMLYETLEEQLTEVTASRDEYRKQAIAGGGQYTSILAMATKMEMIGVEDRKKWKLEKDALEERIKSIEESRGGSEKERIKLHDLLEERQREIETLKGRIDTLSSEIVATQDSGTINIIRGPSGTPEESIVPLPPPNLYQAAQETPKNDPSARRISLSELESLRTEKSELESRIGQLEKTIEELRNEGLTFAQEFMERIRGKDRNG